MGSSRESCAAVPGSANMVQTSSETGNTPAVDGLIGDTLNCFTSKYVSEIQRDVIQKRSKSTYETIDRKKICTGEDAPAGSHPHPRPHLCDEGVHVRNGQEVWEVVKEHPAQAQAAPPGDRPGLRDVVQVDVSLRHRCWVQEASGG